MRWTLPNFGFGDEILDIFKSLCNNKSMRKVMVWNGKKIHAALNGEKLTLCGLKIAVATRSQQTTQITCKRCKNIAE